MQNFLDNSFKVNYLTIIQLIADMLQYIDQEDISEIISKNSSHLISLLDYEYFAARISDQSKASDVLYYIGKIYEKVLQKQDCYIMDFIKCGVLNLVSALLLAEIDRFRVLGLELLTWILDADDSNIIDRVFTCDIVNLSNDFFVQYIISHVSSNHHRVQKLSVLAISLIFSNGSYEHVEQMVQMGVVK